MNANGEEPEEIPPFIYFYPPENSFGMDSFKQVNPLFIKQLLKDYTEWGLFYKRYGSSSWTNGNEYLSLNLSWNNTINAYKITLGFNAVINVYQAEFRMGFNKNILNYIEKSDSEVWFNYSTVDGNIGLFFNYSDIKSINGLYFDKGIFNNMFWFRFGRFNIPAGVYVFDPIFGDNTVHYSGQNVNDKQIGLLATMGSQDGILNNVSARMRSLSGTVDCKANVYTSSGVLVETSFANSVAPVTNWYTFYFSNTSCLTAYADYYITVFSNNNALLFTESSGSNTMVSETDEYTDGAETPVIWDTTDTSAEVSIYASYTEGCGGGCINETLIQPISITNGTTNINHCITQNWTALINGSCCNDIDYCNISCNGLYNNVSGNNGTYHLNITNLNCGQSYTVYVNASSCDGGDVNRSWFTFSTLDCCNVTIEGINNNTFNNYDYNLTYVNVSFYNNCSCNNTIEYTNISIDGIGYNNQSGFSEGLHNHNFTGLTLICNTDYKINITTKCNLNCSNITKYYYFWLNTSNCYTPTCCNYTIDIINIVNKTTGINATLTDYINFSFYLNTTCSDYNFSFVNISFLTNYSNQTGVSEGLIFANFSVNLSCGQNYSWYIVFSKNITNCSIISLSFWFRTSSCGGGVSCCDCFNDTCFTTLLNSWLISNHYVKESDFMDLAIANSQLSIFLTLILFGLFFYIGYTTKRKSGGAFVMFSGFIFIGLSLLIGSYLNAIYVTPLMLPFAGFIILVGVKKWLYEEPNKTED